MNVIKVYKSPLSEEIIARFKNCEDLFYYTEKNPNTLADQVEVNGMQLLGWDEFYDFYNI